MKTARRAVIAVFELAWKCGIIVIATALTAPTSTEEGIGARFASMDQPSRVHSSIPELDTTEVDMEVAAGKLISKCSLRTEDGGELLRITYDRSGCIQFALGDAFPVRPGCTVTRDGRFNVAAMVDGCLYRLDLRAGGTSMVDVYGDNRKTHERLKVTPAGELVHDPCAVE